MLHIVKIGGQIIDDSHLLSVALESFYALKGNKILIHGGGSAASRLSEKIGIQPKIIEGRRITDAQTLDIVVMTYAGLINKTLVAKLQAMGCNALGLSGADANLICATQRVSKVINYGCVGDLNENSVNKAALKELTNSDFIPVFCAITHDGKGTLLNTNADTVACTLAIALAEKEKVCLHYCFEKKGVLKNPKEENSYFKKIVFSEFQRLKQGKVISQGMIPKLQNAFEALNKGVYQVSIGHPTFLNHPKEKTILCL
ncbi:acetylglutamate kinase [Bacteroidetes bacterium endosymbiont of Geopemphigus sp.]|uniref:acetylglutamate kinase n=1 Tax=Bacteroidetes bacterium endosymbiont of Geopemphigus sp. TaxID=2047937 RepID=UPI000CD013A7|nr:acetylglutamate kinase [Bacteroidetes bacterium endosymbiont of Geopemphigus sp.]